MTQDVTPYYQAARFPNQQKAGEVYFPLQQMIFEARELCDLSVYRFKFKGEHVWHVVVVGVKPPIALHERIEAALTRGVLVSLKKDVLDYLSNRRIQASQIGPWVEVHYDNPEEGG
jgi:hypothetical protein